MPHASSSRNIALLSLCQALFMIGTSTMATEASLVGQMLASNKALATLPVALQQLAVMLTTFPASYLMRRFGRRAGFGVGAGFGIVGALIATVAVLHGSFALFCLGAAVTGIYNGFGTFYRFAAADATAPERRGRAVSYVLAGGVLAAAIGPELAKHTKDMLLPAIFAGSFASLVAVAAAALIITQFLKLPTLTAAEQKERGRPLGQIMRQPTFIVAAIAGIAGYATMTLVMQATPLSMLACGHPFEAAAFVIQWHVVGMFAPSFFSGRLVDRFGAPHMILVGAVLEAMCGAVNLTGTEVSQFWLANFLLGVGWNFMFVGSTALLTRAYRPAERAKTQAANDFLMFGLVACAALSSGALINWFSWNLINVGVLPLLLAAAVATLWLIGHKQPVAA
jgi:MFS family permease